MSRERERKMEKESERERERDKSRGVAPNINEIYKLIFSVNSLPRLVARFFVFAR